MGPMPTGDLSIGIPDDGRGCLGLAAGTLVGGGLGGATGRCTGGEGRCDDGTVETTGAVGVTRSLGAAVPRLPLVAAKRAASFS